MNALRRLARGTVVTLLRLVPVRLMELLVYHLAAGRAHGLPPRRALAFLFRLDQRLYHLQGEQAIAYGDGVHPKHRLMRYHDFFVVQVRPGERVLDIGCGIGAVAHDVAAHAGGVVTGIDRNARQIEAARRRYQHPRLRFIAGDALTDLPAEFFDVVILSNILEHLDDRPAFLRQLAQRVRPGRYLIRVPLFERDWRVPLKRELGVDYYLDPTHCVEYGWEELQRELAQAGLEVARHEIRWGEIWCVSVPAAARRTQPVPPVQVTHG